MDENGVMRMDAFSGSGRGSRDLISPQTDRSLLIEISMLKDNLEKEQQRRKVRGSFSELDINRSLCH